MASPGLSRASSMKLSPSASRSSSMKSSRSTGTRKSKKDKKKEESIDFDDDMLDDFNFGDLKISESMAKKIAQNEYISKKPSKTFALIKSEMDEKAKRKSKSVSRVDEVAYVDKQRNIAISLGERDVKADVKAKNKRERPGAAVLRDGESDAEAFLAQGELEMKKGSDGKRCLFYLDKAVELNDYDEEAFIARSKCYHHLARNKEAIEDALFAVEREPFSVGAKEALGTALYSSGYFETALVEFHKVNRLRQSNIFDDWITRCEETIKAFLDSSNIEIEIVAEILRSEESQNWMNVIEFQPVEANTADKLKSKRQNYFYENQSEEELQLKEMKERLEKKKTGLLMGKLHDDMIFLDKIANHPALQKNILMEKEDKPPQKDIDKVLKEIRGAAMDGLNFLEVRKSFWETSEPPSREAGRKCLRRSRSEHSSRTRLDKIRNESKLSVVAV